MRDELSKKLYNMTSQLENSIHSSNSDLGRRSFRGYNSRGRSNWRGNPGRGYWQNNSSNYPNTGNYGNHGNRGWPHPNRKLFYRRCGKYGHTQSNCWSVPQNRPVCSIRPQPKKLYKPHKAHTRNMYSLNEHNMQLFDFYTELVVFYIHFKGQKAIAHSPWA